MRRTLIWTASQVPIGELVAEQLREQGLPVTTVPTNIGEMYPTPFLELWLEDEQLLEDPEVQQAIRDAIDAHPISDDEAEEIEKLPFRDVPERPLVNIPKNAMPIVIAGVVLIAALLVYFVWRTINT